MDKNFHKSFQRLFLCLAMHCRRHRLANPEVENLSEAQRRKVITATLDVFEQEIRLHKMENESASEATSAAPGDERQRGIHHPQPQIR